MQMRAGATYHFEIINAKELDRKSIFGHELIKKIDKTGTKDSLL